MSVRPVLAFLLAMLSAVSVAPAPAAGQDARQARRLFDEGVRALREGRVAESRERFERSYALVPRASTLYNLGVAHRRAGDTLAAIDVFERVLRGEHGGVPASQRAAVEEQLEGARGELAHLVVSVDAAPGAVWVRVDGRSVAEGIPPLRIGVDAGRHVVRVGSAGHATVEREVALERGAETPVQVTLEPEPAPVPSPAEVAARSAREEASGVSGVDPTWVVVGVAAGVAVVVGIVVAVVVATAPPGAETNPAIPGGAVITLTLP